MTAIRVLDSATIDKIAAGEVVERPSSVVKELVENALDAGADAITVEIKEGGITFIRVTDNGCGIESSQIANAFMRHATSKITSAEDLSHVKSLGFRGEALSSICAVSQVELMTRTKENLTGIRYVCEGAVEKECTEIGAPPGTTIIVRNLFYNTPVRRNFLRQPMTEAGYIIDLCEHIALSRPDTALKLIVNGQIKFHTSGNGNLKEVIYRIYGKETSSQLLSFEKETEGIKVSGYLGKPILNRSNRNFENYFINGRYIKSSLIAKALEDGYSQYLMQHKFPFAVIHFTIDTELVDVNVHPTKMDVRFTNGNVLYDFISLSVADALKKREMIPEVLIAEEKPVVPLEKEKIPEPFETNRMLQLKITEEKQEEVNSISEMPQYVEEDEVYRPAPPTPKQLNLFEEKMISETNKDKFRILGQVFDTYWLISFSDKLLIVDQHAAHEKVKYERLMKQYREKQIVSQSLNPPIVVTLTAREEETYQKYSNVFADLGFEIEDFGGREYALRGVPQDLYGQDERGLFLAVLDEMADGPLNKEFSVVEEKLASMACKSAVKGNHSFSFAEMEALLNELFTLDNPYNCPHGRPTIISMSKYELEKKFKRII